MTDNIGGISTLGDVPNRNLDANAPAMKIPDPNDADGGTTLSYGELRGLIRDTATVLRTKVGLDKDDVVSIAMPNTMPFVLSFIGATWCRGISAPLNPKYTKSEYKFYMEDAKVKLLLVPADGNEPAEAAALELGGIAVYTVDWSAEAKTSVKVEHKSGLTEIRTPKTSESDIEPNPIPSDVALFLHTSGTTARPKGVPLTHANLVASLRNIIATYSFTPSDVTLLIMPLFHVHGLMSALLSTLASGGCVILPPEGRFAAGTLWTYVQNCKVTWFTGVPTMHQILLGRYDTDFPKDDPPQLRFIRSCSASLAPAILEQMESKFGAPVLEAYAMTEAAHQMCSNPFGKRKAGTVGKSTGMDVVIMEPDGETVAKKPRAVGEVCIRGSNVMGGYNNVSDEVNRDSFKGGYFHTGDQGYLDEEGYLTLTGRIKELINRGGEKISPLEVDAAMLTHEAVGEAVAFSIPDEKYGEVVGAAIVLKADAVKSGTFDVEQFKTFLSDKLSSFKIPQKVFVDDTLPKTATGKIQRRIVAAHFLKDDK